MSLYQAPVYVWLIYKSGTKHIYIAMTFSGSTASSKLAVFQVDNKSTGLIY